MNSHFLYRWSRIALHYTSIFPYFLFLYLTRIANHNRTPYLKSPKKKTKQKSRLGTASNQLKITWRWGGAYTSLRSTSPGPWFCFGSLDKTTTHNKNKTNKPHKQKAKRAAGIEGQVATMLETHTRQIDTRDAKAMKRAKKNDKNNNQEETKQKCRLGTSSAAKA